MIAKRIAGATHNLGAPLPRWYPPLARIELAIRKWFRP